MRVLIADDDISMRFVLRKALEKIEGMQVAFEASNGSEAVMAFDQQSFDAAFLDVDMPVLDGIEAAKLILDINPKCLIVFVTAHEKYMQEAFELYAFDYMVKPFKLERLNHTVERMKEFMKDKVEVVKEKVDAYSTDLLLKVKDGLVVVRPEEIIMIEREDRSSVIITEKEHYSINKTLNELEAILPDEDFLRTHKSYIIRLDKIEKMSIYGRWTYVVKLKGTKKDALMTKEKAKILETLFNSI
ncbi:MAG: response regulator transcription factor [Vallitaleaceae bacterium]|nr:response regulator transcription factor [Vallitaleaceae bacterium]